MSERVTRRAALAWVGNGTLALAGGVIGGIASGAGGDAWTAVKNQLFGDPKFELTPQAVRLARSIMFGNGRSLKIVPASSNPISNVQGERTITAPAKYAVDKIVRLFELGEERIARRHNLATESFSGNICSIGGPIANRFTELIVGQDGLSPLTWAGGREVLRFPIFVDNVASIDAMRRGTFLELGNLRRPIWCLNVGGRRLVPDHSSTHPREDFLLVTNIPNILDREGFELGHRICLMYGANGPGTRAIKNLLEDPIILAELGEKAKTVPAEDGWQAVIHVERVDRQGIAPEKIGSILSFNTLVMNFKQIADRLYENI